MKIIGIDGSPREESNTAICIAAALEAAEAEGVETEQIRLREHDIARGCTACLACREAGDGRCLGVKDGLNPLLKKVYEADALIAGSPVYFGSATPELMAFLQRMGYVARGMKPYPLSRKIAAGVAVARRAGHNFTLDQIQNVVGPLDMTLAGSSYWAIAFGGAPGSVREDEEGMRTMRRLGENVAWLVKKTAGGR
jgi:multimeric flavodoxin WrbA